MNEINSIPVITVTARNVDQLSDVILSEIEHADFIAVDQELSGLGNTAGRARLDMTNYYGKLREAAEGYRVISLGISCFKSSENFIKPYPESCDPLLFTCTSFNILLMPDGEFEMDGSAKRFLDAHGFDLNQWVDDGIVHSLHGNHNDFVAKVTAKLLTTKGSLVFHNGLTDLAYFYHSFYNPLPKGSTAFIADVTDMFGPRLFDTKVICNKVLGWRMHGLEYCYKKAQRVTEKSRLEGKPAVALRSKDISVQSSGEIMSIPLAIKRTEFSAPPKVGVDVCELVYHFGFCNSFKTGACPHSVELHQMDLVLDVEEQKRGMEIVHEQKVPASSNIADLLRSVQQSILTNQAPPPIVPTPPLDCDAAARLESRQFCDTIFRPPPPANPSDLDPTKASPVPSDGNQRHSVFNGYVPKPGRGLPYARPAPFQPTVHPQRLGTGHFTIDNSRTYNVDFGLHSAGFDAFMTGYVFSVALAQLGRRTLLNGRLGFTQCDEYVGRVHVTGKMEPCVFKPSVHVKNSARHTAKIGRIRGADEAGAENRPVSPD